MRSIASLCAVLVLLCQAIHAAPTGRVIGAVVDQQSRQPLPGVSIALEGGTYGGVTGEGGSYAIDHVPEGVFRLQASHIGYQTGWETDVRVVPGKTTHVRDIELGRAVLQGAEMIVTAGLFAEPRDAPVSTFRATREEIRRAPGAAGDVFRSLDALPGVSSSGGEFSSYYVRGAGPRDNLILVDNIPFEKVAHFDGGALDDGAAQGGRFSVFVPGLVDEARFQAGGFPARYGGKRASYLDLRLRDGNRQSPTLDARYDLFGWEVNYDGPALVAGRTGLLLSARHEDLERILQFIDEEEEGAPSYTDLIAKTTTDLGGGARLSTLVIHAPERMRRDAGHVAATKDLDELEDLLLDNEEARLLIGTTWQQLLGSVGFLETTIYYRHNDRDWRLGRAEPGFTEDGLTPEDTWSLRQGLWREDQTESELGLRTALTATRGRDTEWTVGLEARRLRLDFAQILSDVDTLYTFDHDDRRGPDGEPHLVVRPEDMTTRFDGSGWLGAGYLEMSTTVGALRVNPGLRLDIDDLASRNYLSPRLSASLGLGPRTRVGVATGVYYQAPQLAERTASAGNRRLHHERAVHLIGSLSHVLREDVRLTGEAYAKRFDDLVVQPDRTSPLRTNQGDGWAAGLDVGIVKRLTEKAYGQVSYAHGISRRDDHDGTGSYDADFSQPHLFSVVSGYEASDRWAFSARWRYATGRPTDRYRVHEDVHGLDGPLRFSQEITQRNGDRLPAAHSLNVRVDYRRPLGGYALVGFLDILNVYGRLNPNYELFLPRTGTVKRKGIEMVPSLGLRIEI